jgi:hypothetical protein
MEIRGKGVEFYKVQSLIEKVSTDKWDGELLLHPDAKPLNAGTLYGFQGRLVAVNSRSRAARCSWSGRRLNAACWHAWRDAIRAVLTEYPDAVVKTSQARYDGLRGFEATYPNTAGINIGSLAAPAYMPELCSCGDDE